MPLGISLFDSSDDELENLKTFGSRQPKINKLDLKIREIKNVLFKTSRQVEMRRSVSTGDLLTVSQRVAPMFYSQ